MDELFREAAGAADAVKTSAADVGTRAHAVIDELVRGNVPERVEEDVAGVVSGFQRWLPQSGLRLDSRGDVVVVSHKYQYAGAADCIATVKGTGQRVVLDFKTSNRIYDTYALQLAAYAHAINEMEAAAAAANAAAAHNDGATDNTNSSSSSGGGGGASAGTPPTPITGAIAVRFDKRTGAVESLAVRDLDVAFDTFKAALLLWRVTQGVPLLEPWP